MQGNRDLNSMSMFEPLESRLLMAAGPDLVGIMNYQVMPTTIVPGEGGTIRVDLTNQGDVTVQSITGQKIAVRIYLSSDKSLDQNTDILLGQIAAPIIMPAGKTGTVSVPVKIPTDMPAGQYHLILQVDTDGLLVVNESNIQNNIVAIDALTTVKWAFGSFDGRSNVTLTLAGAQAGSTVVYKMSGQGMGQVANTAATVPDGKVGYDMALSNTTSSTSVTVTPSSTANVVLGGVTSTGSLKSLTASNVGLVGDFNINGSLGSLTLGDVGTYMADDIAMSIGAGASVSTFTAKLGRVANLQFQSDIAVKSFTAIDWQDSSGTQQSADLDLVDAKDIFDAPTLSTLKITGKGAVKGNFNADLNITGDVAKKNLSSATIYGDINDSLWTISGSSGAISIRGIVTNSAIRSTGSISSISVGAAIGSDFLAGIADTAARHAQTVNDFLNTTASIGSFTVKGIAVAKGDPVPRFFADSNISAAKVGAVKLVNVELDNGNSPFGLFVKDIPGVSEVKSVSASDVDSGFTWSWKPKIEADFNLLPDFTVTIL